MTPGKYFCHCKNLIHQTFAVSVQTVFIWSSLSPLLSRHQMTDHIRWPASCQRDRAWKKEGQCDMSKLKSVKHCFKTDGICSYCVPKCVTLLMGRASPCIAEIIKCNLLSETGNYCMLNVLWISQLGRMMDNVFGIYLQK